MTWNLVFSTGCHADWIDWRYGEKAWFPKKERGRKTGAAVPERAIMLLVLPTAP